MGRWRIRGTVRLLRGDKRNVKLKGILSDEQILRGHAVKLVYNNSFCSCANSLSLAFSSSNLYMFRTRHHLIFQWSSIVAAP